MIAAGSTSGASTVAVAAATIAALAALISVVLTSWFGTRRDRQAWLRDQRIAHSLRLLNLADEIVRLANELRRAHKNHAAWHAEYAAADLQRRADALGAEAERADSTERAEAIRSEFERLQTENNDMKIKMDTSHDELRSAHDHVDALLGTLSEGQNEILLLMSLTAVVKFTELVDAVRKTVGCLTYDYDATALPAGVEHALDRELVRVTDTKKNLVMAFRREIGNSNFGEDVRGLRHVLSARKTIRTGRE